MTIMIRRPKTLPTKVWQKVMGTPNNMKDRNNEHQRYLTRRLASQNTSFVR